MLFRQIRWHSSTHTGLLQRLKACSTQGLVDALWTKVEFLSSQVEIVILPLSWHAHAMVPSPVKGWPNAMIEGPRPLRAEQTKMAGRAVTLRFVPHRPDIAEDKPKGPLSPEYCAFELCGPDEVLVVSATGPWESVGGDIKFMRLMQRQVAGSIELLHLFFMYVATRLTDLTHQDRLVTDGAVRDTKALSEYGFPVFR